MSDERSAVQAAGGGDDRDLHKGANEREDQGAGLADEGADSPGQQAGLAAFAGAGGGLGSGGAPAAAGAFAGLSDEDDVREQDPREDPRVQ